jgi:hypothetical protein
MAESDFVFAVHDETKIVSLVPRSHLEIFPLTELSESEVKDLRAEESSRVFGTEASGTPSESWKKAELQGYADSHGIEYDSNATKADLLDAITAQEG